MCTWDIDPEHLHGEMRGLSFSYSSEKQILHMVLVLSDTLLLYASAFSSHG